MNEEERAGSQAATQVAGGATDSDREAVAREIGAQLKEGREAQRLSLEDVGARLKVAPSKLVAIEAGNVSSLADVTFAKGVMRAYARTLQINIDGLLGQYHAQAQAMPVTGITRRHEGALNQAFDDRKRFGGKAKGTGGAGGRWLWLVCVLALAGAGVYFGYDHAKAWLESHNQAAADAPAGDRAADKPAEEGGTQSNGDGTVSAALPPVMAGNDSPAPSEASPASATTTTTTTTTPTTATGMPLATGGAVGLPQDKPAAQPVQVPATATAATPGAPAAPAATGDGAVQIRFAADTWYEVRDRTGKVIMGGTGKAGDAVAGSGAGGPYKVVLGNVKGVESMAHNGAPVNFKAADRNNVARLTLQ
ncbi:RodZ domain-containing protein [Cupriavidus pauculus]|uniref:Helix-turn-helix domain-containing protein n=1 Tax=Cupriavidus pauculus TaxID=82633 RepID=A0A3G8H1R4_9BURK|nr:RodZ domain-containing protein [Cupriavidus pauculus]AZG14130.1 helix-turn-helix domain-containing protein [Cupriavidus pauculus]